MTSFLASLFLFVPTVHFAIYYFSKGVNKSLGAHINSGCQEGDMEQVPRRGLTHVARHRKNAVLRVT
jgi:hypothetical protein